MSDRRQSERNESGSERPHDERRDASEKLAHALAPAAIGSASSQARPAGDRVGPADGKQAEADVREYGFGSAYLQGMGARFAYLGLRGKLFVADADWQSALKRAGPVGEQLIQRLDHLKGKGWTFGSLGLADPYWELKGQGYASRIARMTSLGGYHWDVHDGVLANGKFVEDLRGLPVKRVTYNRGLVSLANVLGYGYGTSDPVKNVATIMAHELGHEDGILREHPGSWKSLSPGEQKNLAMRMLATESRAIVTQLHVAQQLGDSHIQNTLLRSALRSGDLGGVIFDTWGKSGGKYDAFAALTRREAAGFVNSYLDETFGKDLINRSTGQIRPFDINAGFGKQIGSIAGDAELSALMAENRPGVPAPQSRAGSFLTETASGRALLRGGQALAAVGVLATVHDLRGAFKESPVAGLARLARVGVDWGGFEAGTAVSMMAAERLAMTMPAGRMGKLIPFLAIAGGMGGAHAADKYFGTKVEKALRSTPEYLR